MSQKYTNKQHKDSQDDSNQDCTYQKVDKRKSLNDMEFKKQIDISLSKINEILNPSSPNSLYAIMNCLSANDTKNQDSDFKKLKDVQKEANKEYSKFVDMLSESVKICESKVYSNYNEMVRTKKNSRTVLEDLKSKMNKDFSSLY